MADRRVALLRGINVGNAKRVAMADLRPLFEDLGHGDVRTLLNSGNVVFTVGKREAADAERLEREIEKRLGVSSRVTVLTGKEVAEAVGGNPFASIADNPSRLLIFAPWRPKDLARLKPLLAQRWKPEALALGKRVAYLWCGDGIVDSKLWAAVNKVLGEGTSRNFATMSKLLALVEENG